MQGGGGRVQKRTNKRSVDIKIFYELWSCLNKIVFVFVLSEYRNTEFIIIYIHSIHIQEFSKQCKMGTQNYIFSKIYSYQLSQVDMNAWLSRTRRPPIKRYAPSAKARNTKWAIRKYNYHLSLLVDPWLQPYIINTSKIMTVSNCTS